MSTSSLTEAQIRRYASGESFRRGQDYHARGAVLSLVRRGNIIEAEVEGSNPHPYIVHCTFEERGAPSATCTCPYDWGGWCKHIVAACLSIIHDSEQIEERPALAALLADLDREQLLELLVKLAERDPSLPDTIEGLLVRTTIATKGRPVPLDPAMVRRQVQAAFQQSYNDDYDDYDNYWDEGEVDEAIFDDLEEILERIQSAIAADEGYNTLLSLQAFTEAFFDNRENLDYENYMPVELLEQIGKAWTEALLSTDLTAEERKFWIKKLDEWMLQLDEDEEYEGVFEAAQDAAARGWGYPPLQRVLQGESEQSAWEGEAPDYAEQLTTARLNVLERRGRFQEYVNLAKAEGHIEAYLKMLVRLGQSDEAVSYGLSNLETASQAFTFAQALDEQGEHELSLQVAEHGLSLPGIQTPLAKWLRERAVAANKPELALRAAVQVFQDEITLANYLRVRELAGERWEQMRDALRTHAKEKGLSDESITIFLHDGLIDDAIAAVHTFTSQTVLERLADAALPTRPEWAISVSRGRAETLIQQGAGNYEAAAHWLAKARAGYQRLGAMEEWRTYLSEVIQKHKRKYKLMREMEGLQ